MLSIVFMNKRSILTAVLALGLGVTALTGCATDSDSAHSYVTPKDVKTVERPIAQIDDSGIKVPEKRDLKVVLPESDMAADYKVDISDPETLSAGKPRQEHHHPASAQGDRRGRGPRDRDPHRQGRHHHRLQGDRHRGAPTDLAPLTPTL